MWMKVKYVNAKIFDIISRVNEGRSIAQEISCEYKCGMHESESKNGIMMNVDMSVKK